jgi:hypothetical protein
MKSAGLMFENRESFGALVLFIEVCEVLLHGQLLCPVLYTPA